MANVSIKQHQKENLARHKRAVHEGIKYPCGQCQHEATSKGSLVQHRRAVHEGIKYPCGKCQYEATSKGDLTQHGRAVHEVSLWTMSALSNITRKSSTTHKSCS